MNENINADLLSKFGNDFQTKTISSILSDRAFLERILDILLVEYYESDSNKWIVQEIKDYFIQYKDLPTLSVFKVKCDSIQSEILKLSVVNQLRNVYQKISDKDLTFIKETFLEFCKNQSLKNAMLIGVEYLKNGEYEKIRTEIDKALKAGTERNLGHDYFLDVEKRLSETARKCIKTNWVLVDNLLDGGLACGELGVLAGGPGAGKSWILQRTGVEALKQGKNVIHFTMELQENYVGRRYDSCLSGIDFQAISKQKDTIRKLVEDIKTKNNYGKLKIKYFPLKTVSALSLKTHLERCQTIDNIKYDLMIVDYADIIRPISSERNSNSYQEAGSIYEELRMVAGELQIPVWTASQCNKLGEDVDVVEAKHLADSFRKVMTADFAMSVSRKREDKAASTARFYVIKNRFGADGVCLLSTFNASNGSITMYDSNSKEGVELQSKMDNEGGEDVIKKILSNKWQQHTSTDDINV